MVVQQVPAKKGMGCVGGCLLAILIVFIIGGIGGVLSRLDNKESVFSDVHKTSSYNEKQAEEQAARRLVSIVDWSWTKKGFDNVMEADFTITNGSPFDIKDIEIKCVHSAKSGTKIDSNTRTIYEVIKAGEAREFRKFSMGFIHSQATASSASIQDFVIIR